MPDIALVLFGGAAALLTALLTPPLANLLRDRGGAWYVGRGGTEFAASGVQRAANAEAARKPERRTEERDGS